MTPVGRSTRWRGASRLAALIGTVMIVGSACSAAPAATSTATRSAGASATAAPATATSAATATAAPTAAATSTAAATAATSGSPAATQTTGAACADLHRMPAPGPLGTVQSTGPDGEPATWYDQIQLTCDELATIKAGGFKAAFLNHTQSPFMQAIIDGATAAFKDMGIELVAVTNANLDPAQQARDVQNVMPQKPNIILSLAIDPTSAVQAFKPAHDAGVSLVFLSNKPAGYVPGTDYVTTVTYDISGLGSETAKSMCTYFDGKPAKIGYMYFDAKFYITNQREQQFLDTLAATCPNVEIVERQPMADPSKTDGIASAMLTKHPEIQAIFAPWDGPAEGVVATLRAANRPDVKVFTIDLGNTNLLDMAKDGNIYEMTSTLATEFGYTAAVAGAYGLIKKQAPPFVVVPVFAVTKENLEEGWKNTFNTPLPADIADALK
jgi:ribose transport system substrate-binding protein